MDNQRAIQLLQAHIDAADMPLFSQAAAIGIRALERVDMLEAELAMNKDAWKWVADNMAKVECRQTGTWLCSVVFSGWASTGTGPTPLEAVLDVMEQRKGK